VPPSALCCLVQKLELRTETGSKACNDAQEVLIVLFPFGDQSLNVIRPYKSL